MYGSVGLIVAVIVGFKTYSKLEVCRTYYPEISTISCYFSDYGLPPVRGK